jgi:hypothetical protein
VTEAECRQLIRRIHDCLEMASFSIGEGSLEIAAYALHAARKALNESLPPSQPGVRLSAHTTKEIGR